MTSIDTEILLLDEGIEVVDAAILNKARDRLVDPVKRFGRLVFARVRTTCRAMAYGSTTRDQRSEPIATVLHAQANTGPAKA